MTLANQPTVPDLTGASLTRKVTRRAATSANTDALDGRSTTAVAKLSSLADIEKLIQGANKSGTGIIPVSSTGRGRHGHTITTRDNAVIADLSGMKNVLNVDGRDKMAIIEPGVDFGSIDALLKPHGLRANRPLAARAGKSVIASYLEREPLINPHDHWDVTDPFGGTVVVYGDGTAMPTGGAAIEGTLKEQLKRGHRHIFNVSPGAVDPLRLLQGAQGTLGIMAWAAVSCERIPVIEQSWFASAKTAGPVLNLARDLLHRRLGSALFLLDATSLALMMSDDAASFTALKSKLPAWTAFVSLSAASKAPEQKMAWQSADLESLAKEHGAKLESALGGMEATAFGARIRQPTDASAFDRALGDHCALFFLTQLDRVEEFGLIARSSLNKGGFKDLPLGAYVQPMAQGVFAHLEFTVPHAPGELAGLDAAMLKVAQDCADAGAFFSRPYGGWADIAYDRDPALLLMLKAAKSILDPAGVMNPGRLPY